MRSIALVCLLMITAFFLSAPSVHAEVTFEIKKQLKLDETPLDVKIANSGRWLYVLTDDGYLRVYSDKGAFSGKMNVGKVFDQIEPGHSDDEVLLKSSSRKSVQVLELTYSHAINIKGSPFKGNNDAPIVIVDFTDFQCPYCAKLVPTFEKLLARYPEQIKIVYKNFPLRSHKFARKAANAAMAAHQEGKFWEFHDKLFANYNRMSDAVINNIRKELNLATPAFDTLMNSPKIRRRVQRDVSQAIQIGVNSTPTVFINGKMQKDKRYEGFVDAIEKELKRLKTRSAEN